MWVEYLDQAQYKTGTPDPYPPKTPSKLAGWDSQNSIPARTSGWDIDPSGVWNRLLWGVDLAGILPLQVRLNYKDGNESNLCHSVSPSVQIIDYLHLFSNFLQLKSKCHACMYRFSERTDYLHPFSKFLQLEVQIQMSYMYVQSQKKKKLLINLTSVEQSLQLDNPWRRSTFMQKEGYRYWLAVVIAFRRKVSK